MLSQFDFFRYALHRRLREAPHADRFRARMLVGLSVVSLTFVPITYLYMLPNYRSTIVLHSLGFSLFFIAPVIALILLRWHGSFRAAASVLLAGPLLGLVLFACLEKVSVSGTFFWFAGLGLFGLYLFGLRFGRYWCGLMLLIQMTLILAFKNSPAMVPAGMTRLEFVDIFSGDVLSVTLGIWTIAILYELQRSRSEKELKAAQNQILQHREQLMQGARLTELGQMAGGVAHEINNPLAIVHGYTARLKRDLEQQRELTTEQRAMFHSIERSCLRISTISRALLSYAHEGSYEQDVVFTLQKLQEEFMELCQERMSSRSIQLAVDTSDPEQFLSGKYVKLLQVIVNLLNNAIDAVSTCAEKWIRLTLQFKTEGLLIEVVDSGEGVPEHLRERIKSPFFTTKPIGKGTGLGLSIVDGIVRDIQGQFYLDANAVNTRFVVLFPLVQA